MFIVKRYNIIIFRNNKCYLFAVTLRLNSDSHNMECIYFKQFLDHTFRENTLRQHVEICILILFPRIQRSNIYRYISTTAQPAALREQAPGPGGYAQLMEMLRYDTGFYLPLYHYEACEYRDTLYVKKYSTLL